MRFFKLLSAVTLALMLVLASVSALAQDEEEEAPTAKDTPYFSGMPDYRITADEDRKFDEYNFYNGKDCTTIEGKKMFRGYTFVEGDEPASELQIARNYANAVKNMGGTIIFDGTCENIECAENSGSRMMVGKVVKGGSELWVEVVPFNGGGDYYLTVVAKESMTQDVTASSILDALNTDGRVALYINFDTGKATIRPDSRPIIEQIAQMMMANTGLELSVEGHTDNIGDSKSNQALSENRAKSVKTAIVELGIEAGRLSTLGHGQDKPVADNSSEEGRAKNRRVELVKKSGGASGESGSAKTFEHFTVKIYPGAQLDAEQTKYAKDILGVEEYCYRTQESLNKVIAYYEKLGGLVCLSSDSNTALYTKDEEGSTVRLVIANPWTDPMTGKQRFDTLIQILKGF